MSAIAAVMRSDWRILRFISALWAGVIRDYAPYPSLFHRHVNHRISISLLRGWEGSGWRPLLVTLGFHDRWGRWRGGQILDAHELGMTSVVRSTLATLPVSPLRISLMNGYQRVRRLLFLLDIQRSSWSCLASFKTCLKHAPWFLHAHWWAMDQSESMQLHQSCCTCINTFNEHGWFISHVVTLVYLRSAKPEMKM